MRHVSPLRMSVVVLCLLVPPVFAAEAETGAKSVDAAWVKAIKANDLEGVLACYAPDAVVWMPDAPEASGAKAIRAAYEGFLGANTVQDVTMTDTHYQTSGNLSAGWGRFSMTLVPKAGGAPMTMTGRFTEAVERRGGSWVYVADHASAEPPPAPPAK